MGRMEELPRRDFFPAIRFSLTLTRVPYPNPPPNPSPFSLVTPEADTVRTNLFSGYLLRGVVRSHGARYRGSHSGRTVVTLGANMVRGSPYFPE